jgi:hypothetical protein
MLKWKLSKFHSKERQKPHTGGKEGDKKKKVWTKTPKNDPLHTSTHYEGNKLINGVKKQKQN